MKNIFRAFLAAVALFATVACSQDDNVGRTFGDKAITIDSSSVTFTDAPSTGRVTVKAAGPITKTAVSNDWCKSTFSGNVVTVEATQNTSFTSRVANLTIWVGTDSINVPVHQQGLPGFTIGERTQYLVSNKDTSIVISFRHIDGVSVTTHKQGEWLSPTVENGKVIIKVAANNGNKQRDGYVDISSGRRLPIRINIQQNWDVETQMNGSWTLTYFSKLDTTGLTRQQIDCTFDKDSIRINSVNHGKVSIPFRLKKSIPATFMLDGSVRCGGKLDNYTPLLYLVADYQRLWSYLTTSTTIAGRILPNAEGKLSIRPTGFLEGREERPITRFCFVLHDNVPPTGMPKNNNGFKYVLADFFFPVFVKK